ncbi:MAG: glycosyltransferase family 39 protein [Candidatus Omnitrophota bacterium]
MNHHIPIHELEMEHIPKVLCIYKNLSQSLPDFLLVLNNIRHQKFFWPYPRTPLLYVVSSLCSFAIGFSFFKIQMTFFLFFLILLIFIYKTTKIIEGEKAGVFAMLFISLIPLVFNYSHIYNQDIPLIALLTLSFYFLVTQGFKTLKSSFMLGIICGLGILGKPSFIIYFFSFLIVIILDNIFELIKQNKNKKNIWQGIVNFTVFFIPAFLIFLYWHGTENMRWMITTIRSEALGGKIYQLSSLSKIKENIIFYTAGFFKDNGLLVIAAAGMSIATIITIKIKYKKLLFFWMLLPFFLLIFYNDQALRYLLPAMPPVAMLWGIAIAKLKPSLIKKCSIALVIFLLFYQFFYLSFNLRIRDTKIAGMHNLLFAKWKMRPYSLWAYPAGKKYLSFFEKQYTGNYKKENYSKQIKEYYNYLAFIQGGSVLEKNFIGYLLSKKPEAFMQEFSDRELSALYVHSQFYYISPVNISQDWVEINELRQGLNMEMLKKADLPYEFLMYSKDNVVLMDKILLDSGQYYYLYEKLN